MTRFEKRSLRAFLRKYPDDQLAALLAHAKDGKLSYHSCCCFVGCINSDHALRERADHVRIDGLGFGDHLELARELPGADSAEVSFRNIGVIPVVITPLRILGIRVGSTTRMNVDSDSERRRLIIPLIRAEIKRREFLKAQAEGMLELARAQTQTTQEREEVMVHAR